MLTWIMGSPPLLYSGMGLAITFFGIRMAIRATVNKWEDCSLKGVMASLHCSFNFLFISSSTRPIVNTVCCSLVGEIPGELTEDELIHVVVDSTREVGGTVRLPEVITWSS